MSSFEQHILLGNLGNDPETKEVGESTVCKFRMAVNKKYGDNEYTTWFAVDACCVLLRNDQIEIKWSPLRRKSKRFFCI